MDPINPDHYISDGIETFDVIEAFTKNLTGVQAVCTANVIKYICRWPNKNGIEDLKKARWYLERLIDDVEIEQEIENDRLSEIEQEIENGRVVEIKSDHPLPPPHITNIRYIRDNDGTITGWEFL